jgi:hypothetical protein
MVAGGESCLFTFPVWVCPGDPLCPFNLEECPARRIPLSNGVNVNECDLRHITTCTRREMARWPQLHPLTIPRWRETSNVEMAGKTDIMFMNELSAAVLACFTYHRIVRFRVRRWSGASPPSKPQTSKGDVYTQSVRESSWDRVKGGKGRSV